jgi:hypothetical protein
MGNMTLITIKNNDAFYILLSTIELWLNRKSFIVYYALCVRKSIVQNIRFYTYKCIITS